MTVEEKISHIREAAMEEARARGNEIIDQHQKALEGVSYMPRPENTFVVYYDLEAKGWRTFHAENFLCVE